MEFLHMKNSIVDWEFIKENANKQFEDSRIEGILLYFSTENSFFWKEEETKMEEEVLMWQPPGLDQGKRTDKKDTSL